MDKCKYRVGLVCDFFYPKQGGVEVHLYQLSLALIRKGCKVIVITHHFKNRQGIRYMGNGLKVYYLPLATFYQDDTLPCLLTNLDNLREIIISEDLNLIHCHQSSSILCLTAMNHARSLGIRTVYTDHSLFAFCDLACVSLNKVLKAHLTDIDQCITVSHCCRDNLILRGSVDPRIITVIPNATDFSKFMPSEVKNNNDMIYIVIVCRHTYRKGIDLLIDVIPMICREFQNVNFLIGGDGPKKYLLEEMTESFGLKNRVELLGEVPHKKVRDIMIRGHIYLNTSLTESFGIILLEAASSGLFVVSTDIGGIAEVLPEHMMTLVDPTPLSIFAGLKQAIIDCQQGKFPNTSEFQKELKQYYNWEDVVLKTMMVYDKALKIKDNSIINRIKNFSGIGNTSGFLYMAVAIVTYLLIMFLVIFKPKKKIEKCKSFNYNYYVKLLEQKYGIKQAK